MSFGSCAAQPPLLGDDLRHNDIIAVGTSRITQKPRQWPIRTADGSLACHYEHDVLITDDGPQILTARLADLPIVLA